MITHYFIRQIIKRVPCPKASQSTEEKEAEDSDSSRFGGRLHLENATGVNFGLVGAALNFKSEMRV